jgi:hypothetical protein
VEREVLAMLGLAQRADGWTPPVVRTVAVDGSGVDELLAAVQSYRASGLAARKTAPPAPQSDPEDLAAAARSMAAALRSWEQRLGMPVCVRMGQGGGPLALQVPDVEAAAARLRASGAQAPAAPGSGPVPVRPASGGGVLFELIQQEELSH